MPDIDNSIGKLARLVRDVFRLRRVMRASKRDSALQRARIKIFYFIDPDVLELYTDPDRWLGEVAALTSLYAGNEGPEPLESLARAEHEESSRAVLRATALLTGEYLFSRRLAERFGGNGEALLIAPEHVTDLVGHIARIESRFRLVDRESPPQGARVYMDLRHQLGAQRQLYAAGRMNADQWLDATRTALVRGLAGASHSELLAPYRLARLGARNILVNGASHPEFTADVVAPPIDEIAWWLDEVRRLKRHTQASNRAIEADAVTLTQLVALNREWRDRRRVFVLVSRDRSLHTAYFNYMRKDSANPDRFFAIRHPRQYVPILNVHDMGGQYTAKEIFSRLDRAIEGVVSAFSSTDIYSNRDTAADGHEPDLGTLLRDLRHRSSESSDRASGIAAELQLQIGNIATLWNSAHSYAVAAKADIIAELAGDEASYLSDFFERKMFPSKFSHEVGLLASQFEDLQTGSSLLRREIAVIEAAADRVARGITSHDEHNKRALASEFDRYRSDVFRGQTLAQLVENLPARGRAAVTGLLTASVREERLLVAAAICLDVGAWSAAEDLLRRTRGRATLRARSDLEKELQFFYCVARRLAATKDDWVQQYEGAEKDLRQILSIGSSELENARAQSELFALYLCALAWRAEPPFENRSNSDFVQAVRAMNGIFDDKSLAARLDHPPTDAWRAVKKQVVLNTLDLAFWAWALTGNVSEDLRRQATRGLEYCEAESEDHQPGPHRSIYPQLGRIAITRDDGERKHLSVTVIENIRGVLRRDQASGMAFDLPFVDRIEFEKITSLLLKRLGHI